MLTQTNMKSPILAFIFSIGLSFNCLSQTKLESMKVGDLEIIKPSATNLIIMLEMSSTEWLKFCKEMGYKEESFNKEPMPGYLMMNKGIVGKGGSNHMEKLGVSAFEFNWYWKDSDPKTVFKETQIQLEKNIAYTDSESVFYVYEYKGVKYALLLMGNNSGQIGFRVERMPTK